MLEKCSKLKGQSKEKVFLEFSEKTNEMTFKSKEFLQLGTNFAV